MTPAVQISVLISTKDASIFTWNHVEGIFPLVCAVLRVGVVKFLFARASLANRTAVFRTKGGGGRGLFSKVSRFRVFQISKHKHGKRAGHWIPTTSCERVAPCLSHSPTFMGSQNESGRPTNSHIGAIFSQSLITWRELSSLLLQHWHMGEEIICLENRRSLVGILSHQRSHMKNLSFGELSIFQIHSPPSFDGLFCVYVL